MRYTIIFSLAGVICLVDQLTKWLINQYIALHEEWSLTSFFSLVNVRNRGAAFGFLNNPQITWQFWFFLAATVLAVGVILFIARSAQKNEYWLFAALGAILGGAIGNLIDRIRQRAVVDFLDFHIGDLHWPAFNVADIAICIGASIVAVLMFATSSTKDKNG